MPTTSNFGWTTPADTDLVKDGAAAIRTLGDGVDTSLVDLKGGTTGQILSKASDTDLDYTWIANDQGDITEVQAGTGISVASGTGPIPVVTNTMATEITAKGDLIVGTGSGTFDNLAAGTNGYTLVADSAETTGLKWAAPAGGGKVLQVVNATQSTAISSSSNVYADTGLTATITPSAATSKILVLVNHNGNVKTAANSTSRIGIKLLRGATEITNIGNLFLFTGTAIEIYGSTISASYLDSPNTTSATTYKTQFASTDNTAAVIVQANTPQHISFITLIEIGA